MATLTVKKLLDNISQTIQETSEAEADRAMFPMSALVEMYNAEVRQLSADFPDACTLNKAHKLLAGIDQYIPSTGIALLTISMNMGTNGLVPGAPVVKCELADMQASDRAWMTATAQTVIYNFMSDPADPRHFWVSPPSDGLGYVLEEYSVVPDVVVWDEDGDWETAVVPVLEKYVQKLEKNILARVYKTDTDIPGNIERENDNQAEAQNGG